MRAGYRMVTLTAEDLRAEGGVRKNSPRPGQTTVGRGQTQDPLPLRGKRRENAPDAHECTSSFRQSLEGSRGRKSPRELPLVKLIYGVRIIISLICCCLFIVFFFLLKTLFLKWLPGYQ